MKIGIIVAMDKEFVQLKTLLSDTTVERFHHKNFVTGHIGDKEIILQKCGIGKVNRTYRALRRRTAATGSCTTSQWRAGSRRNISKRYAT